MDSIRKVVKQEVVDGRLALVSEDCLAVEEPLEIRLEFTRAHQRVRKSVAITMRTPGSDVDLALGFLLAEGVIAKMSDVEQVDEAQRVRDGLSHQSVCVSLHEKRQFEPEKLERHFYTTSSCGVCGKASMEALKIAGCSALPSKTGMLRGDLLHRLPEKLEQAQVAFSKTGGLHAAALFDVAGNLLVHREDVGRHNAVDKVIGWTLQNSEIADEQLSESVMLVSSRTSYEILQKVLSVGVPVIASVGAPSSLAVELANEFNVTLIGFLKGSRFNIYSCPERIATEA